MSSSTLSKRKLAFSSAICTFFVSFSLLSFFFDYSITEMSIENGWLRTPPFFFRKLATGSFSCLEIPWNPFSSRSWKFKEK
jgi:hypothetical protein